MYVVLFLSLYEFSCCMSYFCVFFFFKQKTAYEMRISDWSSDVCSSDLPEGRCTFSSVSRVTSDTGAAHNATRQSSKFRINNSVSEAAPPAPRSIARE